MSYISPARKALDAIFWLLFVAIIVVLGFASLAAIIGGVNQNRLDYLLLGVGLSLGTVNYYYWRHPTKPRRPTLYLTLLAVAGLVFLVLAAIFKQDAL